MLKFEAKTLEAPRLPSIFKVRKPKSFNYRPHYFDAEREERERRNRIIRAQVDRESEAGGEAFSSKLRERWEMSNYASKRANSSNLRLIIIIAGLMAAAYFLLT